MPEIVEWVYRNGAAASTVPCGTTCRDMWVSEHGTQPATSQALWDALGNLEIGTNLWGNLSELQTAIRAPALEAGGPAIGWHIALGRDKWLKIGPTAAVAPKMVGCSASAVALMGPGHKFGPTYFEAPELSQWAYVLTDNLCGSWNEIEADTNTPEEASCKPIGENLSPGEHWTSVQWWWNEDSCGLNEHGELVVAKLIAHSWYFPFHFSRPEDWTGQTAADNAETHSASDPGVPAVTTATVGALEASSTLSTWVQAALERSVSPSEEEFGSQDSNAPNRHRCFTGKPVNCATGNQVETQTDLSVGGRGPGLNLTRTYNSQLAAKQSSPGPFGYGWTGPYSAHLEINAELEQATVSQDDGSTVRFLSSSEGWVPAGPLVQAKLVKEGSSYLYTLPDQSVLAFNGSGQLTSETDRNGNSLTMGYGGGGRLETIADPAGRKLTLGYNSEGLIESVKDPMGHTAKYSYEAGKLASVTEPGEASPRWQFKYDSAHQLTTMTDGRGHSVITEYDGLNRVIAQTDALERTRKWKYTTTETGTETAITEPNGSETVEQFNLAGLPTSVTHAAGTSVASTTTSEYDSAGNLVALTDPNKHKSEYGYDSAGDRTSAKDANGHETKWTYNSTHDVETTTTPKGETTTIERDSHGNAIKISRPAPESKTQVTKYKYGSHGDLESVTDPLERTWKYEYDSKGDRIAEIDPESDKRTWGYNEDSQVTSMISADGHAAGGTKEVKYTTTIERDAQGRATLVTAPLKHETKYAYDANGNLESVTDPEANKTSYTYDADNEPTKVEEPNKTITETGYDAAGQVTSQTDGNKHTTEYKRNALEEVTEVVDPLGRKTTKEYDSAGNLKSLTDAAKRTTTYKYDPANRLIEVSYSDGKTPTVEYEYDADGDRTKMIDGTGTSKYTYDQLDRLTETKDGHGDVSSYEYDLANEPTKITYPNGKAVTRAYDNAGRLKTVTDWSEHATKFAYDADSNLKSTTFPSGTSNEDTYAYDEADHMSEVKMAKAAETLASLVYTRNKDGGVTKATTKGLPGEEKPAFTYDENSRLTKGAGIAYKYDAANNVTKIGTPTYTYDAASQLATGTGLKYSYDELGERTQVKPTVGPATNYGYDEAGNLTTVKRVHEGEVAAIEDSYGYDGNGLRASQTILGTTSYLTWDPTESLPLILEDGTNSYIYGPGGLPVEQVSTGGTVSYLHHDQQGSTRLITGSTGTVAGKCSYGAYGTPTCEGTATAPLGYDAQYTSSDTGLQYLRNRVYDPATAQFPTVDPLAKLTGAPYNYAQDNPLSFADPEGLASQYCAGITASVGIVTVNIEGCYVETPNGDGLAGTIGAAIGPGVGANIHYGEGTSNACHAGEYSGFFGQYGGSAEFGSGGYVNEFTNWPSHSRRVKGKTTGETIGLGTEAGIGVSETGVLPLPFGSGGGSSGGCGC